MLIITIIRPLDYACDTRDKYETKKSSKTSKTGNIYSTFLLYKIIISSSINQLLNGIVAHLRDCKLPLPHLQMTHKLADFNYSNCPN